MLQYALDVVVCVHLLCDFVFFSFFFDVTCYYKWGRRQLFTASIHLLNQLLSIFLDMLHHNFACVGLDFVVISCDCFRNQEGLLAWLQRSSYWFSFCFYCCFVINWVFVSKLEHFHFIFFSFFNIPLVVVIVVDVFNVFF